MKHHPYLTAILLFLAAVGFFFASFKLAALCTAQPSDNSVLTAAYGIPAVVFTIAGSAAAIASVVITAVELMAVKIVMDPDGRKS